MRVSFESGTFDMDLVVRSESIAAMPCETLPNKCTPASQSNGSWLSICRARWPQRRSRSRPDPRR